MSTRSEQIAVRLTSEQRERWEHYAAQDQRKLADWIRVQVEAACDRLEAEDKKQK